jgi:hypothetical protein
MEYEIEITPLGIELLSKIKDKREQEGSKKDIYAVLNKFFSE